MSKSLAVLASLLLAAVAPLVLPAPPAAAQAAAQHAAPKPNFIVILTDDQGWGTTSVMIDPLVPESRSDFFKTPNFERFAAAGMRFTQGYASHCNCSPSRAALLTGRSPAALHMTDIVERGSNDDADTKLLPPHITTALPQAEQTIPELLKAADPDYRTALFGKWHLGGDNDPGLHGFDASDGPTGNGPGSRRGNMPDDPKQIFGITERSIAFMKQQVAEGHPFYLEVAHYATHQNWQARPATLERFRGAPKGERHTNVRYGAMLADVDEGIGQLLDAAQAAGIMDHTYIILTADNGSIPTNDPGNINGPVRGHKASVWEGGIRVPFMVQGPGIAPGSVSRTPVVGYDILPTICDLANIGRWPDVVEGGSLKPVLLGDGTAPVVRPVPYLVFHWPHYVLNKDSVPDTTVLMDGWKLHYWWESGNTQLYHLDQDLAETTDVSAQFPNRVAQLKALLFDQLDALGAQRPTPNPHYDPAKDPVLHPKAAKDNGDD